jgi:hypothetical protein
MMNCDQQRLIDAANELLSTQRTGASTSEQIGAAFILNNQQYLPDSYPCMVEAWDRLGYEWQNHVRTIRRDYRHLLNG